MFPTCLQTCNISRVIMGHVRRGDPLQPLLEAMADSVKINVSHVNFYYGTNQALYDVSVQIRPQSVTALIGPSGCGKSTFLRSLNRMNDLIPGARLDGKVELEGENIYSDQMDVIHLRRRVGMILERSNPFPMSIYDNVAYGVRVNGIRGKRLQ